MVSLTQHCLLVAIVATGCATTGETGPEPVTTQTTIVRLHEPSEPADAEKHEAGCIANNAVACHAAALDHYYTPGPENDVAALERFRKACDAGYAASCNGIGAMYAQGRGVAKDEVEAVRWYRMSCAKDASTGCQHLAQAYETGRGVAKDPDAARAARDRGTCLFEVSLKKVPGPCPAAP